MQMRISTAEGTALQGFLQEATGDIIVRIDPLGFIETASTNITDIGYDLSQLLLKPHLADLAEPSYADGLKTYVTGVLSADLNENGAVDWFEFPIGSSERSNIFASESCAPRYALSLRALTDEGSSITGAVGLLRSVDRERTLESEVHARALIDPLTGLSNRYVFCSALRRHLVERREGTVAIFEIDRLRAVFMQYGQRTADEIVWGFAKFLEAMVNEEFELAQFDGERFCVILSGLSPKACKRWADDVLKTFASLTLTTSSRSSHLSASAGLARIEGVVDESLRQAELALVMARARGGMQVTHAATLGTARIAV